MTKLAPESIVFGSIETLTLVWVRKVRMLIATTEDGRELPAVPLVYQPPQFLFNIQFALQDANGQMRPFRERRFEGSVLYYTDLNPPFELQFFPYNRQGEKEQGITVRLPLEDARRLVWELQQLPAQEVAPLGTVEIRQRVVEECEDAALLLVQFPDDPDTRRVDLALAVSLDRLRQLSEDFGEEIEVSDNGFTAEGVQLV